MPKLELTYLGTYWPHGGDLYHMDRGDQRAFVSVDSLGETWVDVRRIPEGGYFHTERVASWRALNGAEAEAKQLLLDGFANRKNSRYAHRVRERSI